MRNLLALIGLAVVALAAIGWYCEWYKLTVARTKDGQPEIKTTVNTEKVADDSSSFFKRVEQLVTEKVRSGEQKPEPAGTPSNISGPIAPVKGQSAPGGSILPVSGPLPPVKGTTERGSR
jgi:hypothetical protein